MRAVVAVGRPAAGPDPAIAAVVPLLLLREQLAKAGVELIDWICALKKAGVDLSRVSGGIPFLGTLLKTEQDVELVGKRAKA